MTENEPTPQTAEEVEPAPASPEETVSASIVAKLEEAGLLRSEKLSEFKTAISEGNLKPEDWYHEIDLASAPDSDEQ